MDLPETPCYIVFVLLLHFYTSDSIKNKFYLFKVNSCPFIIFQLITLRQKKQSESYNSLNSVYIFLGHTLVRPVAYSVVFDR